MESKSKTGSSRRKGDEYQDLTALQLALESYIAGEEFQLFIEYEQAGSLELHLGTITKHYFVIVPNENFNRGGASASGREACLRWPLFFASSLRGASAAKHGQSA